MSDPQPLDMHIVKEELFDADAMHHLSTHEGLTTDMKAKLRKYRKNRYNINHVKIVYSWGKEWASLAFGRLSGPGLQGFDKEIRATLASKYYFDLDMVNSQPVLLVQLCKENGWSCPLLQEYVAMREDKMAQLMTELNVSRAESKELFIQTLFGSKVGWILSHPFLIALTKEMTDIMDNTCLKYPHIYANAKKIRANPKATCLATVIQDEERKVLQVIDHTLSSLGRQMDVLIHDGGLVRKLPNETEFPSDIIVACEEAVAKMGYDISLAIKPLVPTIQFQGMAKKYLSGDVLVSDSYAAKRFVDLLGDAIVYDKHFGRFIFDRKTGMWSQDPNTLRRCLTTFSHDMIFYQVGPNGDVIHDYAGKESNIKNMLCNIDRLLEPIDFVGPMGDSAIGKFLFEDGIYDMETKTFTEGFDPKLLFFAQIPRKYKPKNAELCKKIHKILFEDPYVEDQQEQATWFKRGISRALYGNYTAHKNCYITVGRPNCGRGLLTGALEGAFGRYVGTFQANSLMYNSHNSSDEAKKLAWVIPIINTRLAIGNEVTMDNKTAIDGNQLKTLASGGDSITARLNFKDASSFTIRTTILLQTNDIPPIKPADEAVVNRVIVNELQKTYKETPNPLNPYELKQDQTLKSAFKSEDYKNALFHLMADIYGEWVEAGSPTTKPEALKAVASEWVETTSSIRSILERKYEITTDPEDIVSSRELINYFKKEGCVESETKLGRELTALGCPVFVNKIEGTSHRMRRNIKCIE